MNVQLVKVIQKATSLSSYSQMSGGISTLNPTFEIEHCYFECRRVYVPVVRLDATCT